MSSVGERPIRVLFVCLGNICRSPTAEGVFRRKAEQAGWGSMFAADSAGTAAWHVGKAPDPRTRDHARVRGYDLSALRARQVEARDFIDFDHVFAMDADNLARLGELRAQAGRDAGGRPLASLGLLLDEHAGSAGQDVPDPYYGGADGFEEVLDLIESATDSLLRRLLKARGVFGCGC